MTFRHPRRKRRRTGLYKLHIRLGREMRLDIRFCTTDELERNPVGKIRSCYNRLPPELLARYGLPAV